MRKSLSRRGITEPAINVMLASISPNTVKQYNTAIKRWCKFCGENDVDPLNGSVPMIISFLTINFEKGLGYGSLNNYRSALAFILGPHVGTDDRVKRFFKGVAKLKPPVPKYDFIWDTNIVLNYLESQYPNEELSLEMLTKKLVTLIALCTGHRIQTISLLKVSNINILPNEIIIKVPENIKTSAPGRSQPLLLLPFYNKNPKICPASTLHYYLQVTNSFRNKNNSLFLTFKKPYRTASSDTISRWIKTTLEASGINISMFSSHSTRHASTSKAACQGVNIDVIRQSAGWSHNSSTFARFYNRPIKSNTSGFSTAILDNY